ncbi:acetyl-CoA carboxylase biotin carboxyl carrier protein subunit [Spirochaetia bacterium]|nr:acetyl-CoA carboxylase biotin carboxyl carrier protein subunit [Spirochaetia bacterium]
MNDKLLLTLVDKFNNGSIAELDLDDGSAHLILRKDGAFARAAAPAAGTVPGALPAAAAAGGAAADGSAAAVHLGLPVAPGAAGPAGETITSPIVATFYATPGPDAPAFVSPGSKVKAGDTLCILEAMKMMNHLEAEFDCEILSIKAANGDLVEYGQALFEVKRL